MSSAIEVVSSSSKFIWKIKDFAMMESEYGVESDVFYVGSYKWRVLIYREDGMHDNLSLSLCPVGLTEPLSAEFNIAITNQTNSKNRFEKEEEHFFDSYSSGLSWEKYMRFSELKDPANGFIADGTCVIAVEVSWTLKEDPIVDSKLAGVKIESDPAKIEETETEKKTKLKDGKSGEYPGAGETFCEGRHNNKVGFSDEKEFEDVGGFSILKTQAPIYMQIWLKYGHLPSTQVMPISSYPVLVMVVKDLMNSIIDMHQCRYVELSSKMIEGWEEKIKMAETIKFNVGWLRERFESFKKGVGGMQKVKTELLVHGQPLRAAKSKIKAIEDELKKTEAQLIAAKDYLRENVSGLLSESDIQMYLEIGEDLLLEGLF